MDFQENVLAKQIFKMVLDSKMSAICVGATNKLIEFSTE